MSKTMDVSVPDIGDFAEVEIIEMLVGVGDEVGAESPLMTLESDKATMEIPSPAAGVVAEILVAVGDKVSQGDVILRLQTDDAAADAPSEAPAPASVSDAPPEPAPAREPPKPPAETPVEAPPPAPSASGLPHASPGIRRFARELGADLARIAGSGDKGRITKQDVKNWVKAQLTQARPGAPAMPAIDFSQFGDIETQPLSRIKKLAGPHLQRAWQIIPHVTHHDQADITELEAHRQAIKAQAADAGARVTVLAFAVKVLAQALREFPTFNASLHADGEQLILKKYLNIGVAVDTEQGLVVPVIKNVDDKNIFAIAREMSALSERARAGKLSRDDLQGGSMSISSLGGIGGQAFTPIVNAPEVAILGIARAQMTPQWDGEKFTPRLMLPLALSYDHRVIDGAEGARFVSHLTRAFADAQRLPL